MTIMAEQLYEVGSANCLLRSLNCWILPSSCGKKNAPHPHAQGESLAELRGGLEDSQAFAESPLEIQEKMRHEWD